MHEMSCVKEEEKGRNSWQGNEWVLCKIKKRSLKYLYFNPLTKAPYHARRKPILFLFYVSIYLTADLCTAGPNTDSTLAHVLSTLSGQDIPWRPYQHKGSFLTPESPSPSFLFTSSLPPLSLSLRHSLIHVAKATEPGTIRQLSIKQNQMISMREHG
jgi:hypothetical protein